MNLMVRPVFFKTEKENARNILESIDDLIPSHVTMTEETIINTWDDYSDFQEKLDGVDALLELTENLRPAPIQLCVQLGNYGLPLVLFGREFHTDPRRLEAAGYWRHRGERVYLPLTRVEVKEQLALLAAEHRIRQTRALLIGSLYNSIFTATSDVDFGAARRVLGVEIVTCTSERFLEGVSSVEASKALALAREWIGEADRILEPTENDLEKSARYYLAAKDILEEHRAGAMAINCPPLVEKILGTPCMALLRLNDEGIPAACEGDLTALMTMIFMERLANRPSFLGNIIYANPVENIIEINHCVLPFLMEGYDHPPKPYTLHDYHGLGMGACASYQVETEKPVTVVRFDTDFKELVFLTGRLVGFGEDYCRTNLRVKVKDVKCFIRELRGNHHILVYGDHTKGIQALGRAFGLKVVCAEAN